MLFTVRTRFVRAPARTRAVIAVPYIAVEEERGDNCVKASLCVARPQTPESPRELSVRRRFKAEDECSPPEVHSAHIFDVSPRRTEVLFLYAYPSASYSLHGC